MTSSLLAEKQAIGAYGAEYELPPLFQCGLIGNAITLLVPFEELIREISSHMATPVDVIPT